MSIRMLAVELYRAMKEVEELEKKIEGLAAGAPERESLDKKLGVARGEARRVRTLLDGAKTG